MAKPPDSLFGPGFDPKPSPERDQNRDQGQSQGQSQHGSQKRSPSRALDQTPDPAPGDLLSRNPLADPSVPQRKAADPDRSVWVAASAGTGKTKVLTDRVLRLLLDGAAPERMLCLTFTKAAAAEMTNRVAKVLADWAIDPPDALHSKLVQLLGRRPTEEDDRAARRLFARVLDTPGGLKIRTIHGFCQSLLARFPLEANIPPSFGVLDDTESAALLSLARNRLLARAGGDPTDPVTRALDRLSRLTGEDGFQDLLATLSQERGPVRASLERHGGRAGLKAALAQALDLPPNLPEEDAQGWLLTRACADTAFQGPDLRRVLGVLQAGSASDSKRAAQMAPFLAAPAAERPALWPDYCAAFLSGRDSKAEKIASRLATKGVLSACPDAIEVLTTEGERLLRVRSQLRAALCLEATDALLVLGERFLEDYEQQKRAQGRLDYGDLIALTRKLLTQSGAASWVLYKLDGGLDHLLIDEAQDTSPDQWAVAWDLAEEFFRDYSAREDHRTLFVVGDRKQSIYSFQGADPRAFEAMRQRIAATLAQWADQDDPLPTPRGSGPKSTEPQPTEPGLSTAMRGGRAVPRQGLVEVPLQVSFRSTQAVLDAVNAVFRRDPARQGVVLAGETFEHLSFRQGEGGLVELWPTIAPAPEEKPEPWKPPVEALRLPGARARMAARVASKIKALTAGQEILESSGKPIRPGDIMVLLRVRGGFETELVKALKALDVPVAGVDRMVLGEQLAVQDLIALAQAALLPEDDLTLATVLKGPLFDLSEQRLYDLAQGREGRSLWGQLRKAAETDPEAVPVLKPMVTRLQSLITRARSVRPHDFFSHVLDGAGGRKVLLQRLGSESEDPLDELLSQALARERLGITDLPSFLAWAERDETDIKRDLDQGAPEAVRIMTVHGSKGLQAPIVFLPDTVSAPTLRDSLHWLPDPRGKSAQPPGSMAEPSGSAAEPLDRQVLPLWCPSAADRPEAVQRVIETQTNAMEEEYRRLLYVALTRAADRLYIGGWETKRPPSETCWHRLIHQALAPIAEEREETLPDGETVTILRLTSPQQKPVEPPLFKDLDRAPAKPLPAWATAAAPAEPMPSRPLAPSRALDGDSPVRSPLADPGGAAASTAALTKRFARGQILHQLLQVIPDIPEPDRATALARLLAKRLPDPPDEDLSTTRQALAAEVLAVVNDPQFAALFGPDSRAEVPVVGMVGPHAVSGQVDRLVIGPERAVIVDYKTNRPPPRTPELVDPAYVTQMAAYRAVIEALGQTRQVTCVLLWTDGPFAMPLPEKLLDQALERLLERP